MRLYHPEILQDVEFLLIDNHPAGPCAPALKALENWIPSYRYFPCRSREGTALRDLLFREATGDFVLCVDCHVLFPAGALARLIEYCRNHPESNDLLQGPLVADDLKPLGMCFEPKWSHGMYGVWGSDPRGLDVDAPPFEIQMQGLGAFACRREAWPGFNSRLAGFGGEEGYIHEKIRRAGGRTLCLPFLRWMHRFERPMGPPYVVTHEDRIRNYLLIYDELGLDPAPVVDHFMQFLGAEPARAMIQTVQAELASPFHAFDAIYCITPERDQGQWQEAQEHFRTLSFGRGVRRFAAAETPSNPQIGFALSHRRIVAEAKQQHLETVLVLDHDVRFTPGAANLLQQSLEELKGRDWRLLFLGGYRWSLKNVPGCRTLSLPDPAPVPNTHAIVYHHTVYDAILDAVPDNATDAALWLTAHSCLDRFYASALHCSSFFTPPMLEGKT
jgi:hypothetical protein